MVLDTFDSGTLSTVNLWRLQEYFGGKRNTLLHAPYMLFLDYLLLAAVEDRY